MSSSSRTITAVGCLKSADDMASSTGASTSSTGATGSTQSSAQSTSSSSGGGKGFVLTDAEITTGASGAAGTSGTGSSATSATTGSASSGSSPSASSAYGAKASYRLEGSSSELSPHLNHKVEVTGTLDPGSSRMGTSGAGPTGNEPDTAAEAGSTAGASRRAGKADWPKITVQTVRMISASCS
jgi:hypothetical protein